MEYLKKLEEKFDWLINQLRQELASLRANRPAPDLLLNLKVDYAGQILTIKQLASVGVELPRNLIVTPWDKETLPAISRAIETANLGVAVAVQGNLIRVTLPELTDERRQELAKLVKTTAEQTRIKMRIERDEIIKKINEEPDKDERFRLKEELQKLVDKFNAQVEAVINDKLKEIFN
jgi:ribosome recycling factor